MPDLRGTVLEHANRGVRLQLLLRAALVVFLLLTIILIPPVQGAGASYGIVTAYALGAAAFARWAWRGGDAVAHWGWLGLFADLVVLASLTLVAGVDAQLSWTSNVLVIGFFLLPVLAATQLRPGVCAGVVVPTVVVYLVASLVTQAANDEPWESIILRTFMLASVGVACVGLSRIQRSRVAAIGGLLDDRTRLLDELVHLEDRERRDLSERLHDGALQYVLAARLDLEDLCGPSAGEAAARIDHALAESSRMLRSTVSELHPAVLEHAGLARALDDLAAATARSDLTVEVDVDDWPQALRTPVDSLLFSAARELLSNVVRHADADHARVTLVLDGSWACLVVADDGRGMTNEARQGRLDEGHIGLHSQALRVEAAGGTLTVVGAASGTVATVVVPVTPLRATSAQGPRSGRAGAPSPP
jgi:two-component system NarL family sensor kinase